MDNNINRKADVLRKIVTEGKKVVVLDPENEYKNLAKMLGFDDFKINKEAKGVFIGKDANKNDIVFANFNSFDKNTLIQGNLSSAMTRGFMTEIPLVCDRCGSTDINSYLESPEDRPHINIIHNTCKNCKHY
jgi:hypothetical protein